MGAIPYPGGVTFRVWAPFATSVVVAGTFNNFNPSQAELSREPSGYWSTDVDGAKLGDQYKFVFTGPNRPGAFWRNDAFCRWLTNSIGNGIIADTNYKFDGAGYSTPPWNEFVIYELHVGSFLYNPKSQNGRGNFDSVISKLGYLRDLGINVIQVMPSDEFPGDISFGYNPAYIFAIEQLYGGPDGLNKLVDAAHAQGIAVVYDVVYNHLGPDDLDLWQYDGWNENGHGGIYFYNDYRRVTPWGETRPDYGRGEVRQYIRDNALQWLENFFCDGLRFDATGWIRNINGNNNDSGGDIPDGWSLMQWINNEIRGRQPWKPTIAEDMQDNEWITKDTGPGGAGFGAQWGAGFMHRLRETIAAGDDSARNMYTLRDFISQRFNANGFQRVLYTESHDEVRRALGREACSRTCLAG